MTKLAEFIKKERLYILLLVFVIMLNAATSVSHEGKGKGPAASVARAAADKADEEFFMKPAEAEKLVLEKPHLAVLLSLASLLILATLFLGMIVDAVLLRLRLSGKGIDILNRAPAAVRWNLWDVCKVAILFLFFGYMIVMTEAALARIFPAVKNDNLRMIMNSSVLDILAVVFILYFTVGQYGEKLASLGVSLKNFGRSVFYGAVGYLAVVPPLVGTLVAIAFVLHVTKYVPDKQPVVELFLKERDTAFLAYTTVFAAFAGPVAEELFFRGFMYGALKKYVGIFWAMMVTAALFSALHTNMVGFLPIMVLGIALAYVYEKTGTLVSSITLHTIHNFTMVLFVFLVKQLKA
jgi:uncharacterized protein